MSPIESALSFSFQDAVLETPFQFKQPFAALHVLEVPVENKP
jgi:hypothetical protein